MARVCSFTVLSENAAARNGWGRQGFVIPSGGPLDAAFQRQVWTMRDVQWRNGFRRRQSRLFSKELLTFRVGHSRAEGQEYRNSVIVVKNWRLAAGEDEGAIILCIGNAISTRTDASSAMLQRCICGIHLAQIQRCSITVAHLLTSTCAFRSTL